MKDCIISSGTAQGGKNCPFQRYPSHPQHKMREACGLPLMKTVELAGGRQILYPYKIYSYLSIESSIQSLFNRPNFHLDCENGVQERLLMVYMLMSMTVKYGKSFFVGMELTSFLNHII